MQLFDRLSNFVSGIGTARDKATQGRYVTWTMDPGQLTAAYRDNWIARKCVDIPAFDMTRAGRDWQADGDAIKLIEAEERRLQFASKQFRALKWSRLFGGAVIIMGVNQGSPDQPLRPAGLGKGCLQYIHVMSRYQVSIGQLITDPASPWFGEPAYYSINTNAGSLRIHPSRVVRMVGAELPPFGTVGINYGWGDSVLQAVDDAIKNATATSQGIAALVQEAKVDVFKIPGLNEGVGTQEYRDRLTKRFELSSDLKSMLNAVVMDDAEEYEQKTINFAQLPEIERLQLTIAAGAADIPATRFLGQSPDGMNATGESDMLNYENRLSSEQELVLRPPMERLFDVMICSALGSRPAEVDWKFAPLRQMTEAQQADIALRKAEVAEIEDALGLVPAAALAKVRQNQLLEDDFYPGLQQALDDAEAGLLAEPVKPAPVVVTAPALAERPARVAANDAARLNRRHLVELANDLGIPEAELRRRLKRMIAEVEKLPKAA